MKATELLVNQHREVEQLFEQLESVEEGDEKIVREELARNLVGHMTIEEEMFYPAMREAMPEIIALAEVEHATARYALAHLLAAPIGDAMFRARVIALRMMIRDHVEREEREILPRAEGILGSEHLAQMSRRMESRYEEVVSEDFVGLLKLKLLRELPAMLVPRAAAKTTAKRGAGAKRGTAAKKTTAAAKRGAGATRGASAKRGAPTKRGAESKRATGASGTKRKAQPSARGSGMAGRPTSKRGARKRSA